MHIEVHARRTSGSGKTEQEGHGGEPPKAVGDHENHSTRCKPFHGAEPSARPFRGWPSENANPWSEQSGHRKALSPERVSPGQRARSRQAPFVQRRPVHPPCVPVSKASSKAELQAGYQTKQDQGLIAGRAVVPARGMPKGMGEVCLQ